VVNDEITFEPELAAVSVVGMRVDIWGTSPNTLDTDFHLDAGSPCIDVGNNDAVTDTIDLDGNARVVNSTVDLGAFEVQ
jgi:hypothetical protein